MSETTTEEVTETAAETSGDNSQDSATETTGTEAEAESTETKGDETALGDAGKKALDAMKADRNKARDELRTLRSEFDAFKAKAEGKEKEFEAEQEAQRIKDEALAAANERILKAELRAAAKGKLSDPSDAFRYPEQIDMSSFEVGEDGSVDTAALEAAVDNLIESKPYLAVQDGKRFQGDADAGARKEARPAQLSEQDVKRLADEGKHEEIVKAKAEGRLADYLAS